MSRTRVLQRDGNRDPTKRQQSVNVMLKLRELICASFKGPIDGDWRCKKCNFTCQYPSVMVMFNHLNTIHWKGTVPSDIRNWVESSPNDRNTNNDLLDDETLSTRLTNTESASKIIEERKIQTLTQINHSGPSSSTGDKSLVKELTMRSISNGSENSDSKTNSNYVPRNCARNVNPDTRKRIHVNYESQNIFPIVLVERCSLNVQKTIHDKKEEISNDANNSQIAITSDQRKFMIQTHEFENNVNSLQIVVSGDQTRLQIQTQPEGSGGKPVVISSEQIQPPIRFTDEIKRSNTVTDIKMSEFKDSHSNSQAPIQDVRKVVNHSCSKDSSTQPVIVSPKEAKVPRLLTSIEPEKSDPRPNIEIIKSKHSIRNFRAPIGDVQKELNRRCAKESGAKPMVVVPKETKFPKLSTNDQEHGHNSKPDVEIIKLEDSDDSDTEMQQIPLRNESGSNVGEIKTEQPAEIDIQVPLQNVADFTTDSKRHKDGQIPISYDCIKTEKVGEKKNVAVVTLNRPKALNALCQKLMDELNDAVTKFDRDSSIGAIIITGSEKAFAAGTDIKELQHQTYVQAIRKKFDNSWNGISRTSKPVIAAVNGYALGGGCELALMCDIIYAGETATFGQPEIIIGTIPGTGGTQRLARAIGKSKTMEMVLTGIPISAIEAEKSGLVSKVFPPEELLSEAIKLGEKISSHSQLIVSIAKEAVNAAYETTLQEGLHLEKKLFCGTLVTADRREGMAAFVERRAPKFKNE